MDTTMEFVIGHIPPENDTDFEESWERFQALEGESRSSDQRRMSEFNDDIEKLYGEALDEFDAFITASVEAYQWAGAQANKMSDDDEEDSLAFHEYYDVQFRLVGRAIRVAREVAWLLRGGFGRGAMSRMRTVHELFVTSAALGLYGMPDGQYPDLPARYIQHLNVFMPQNAKSLLATENPGASEVLDDETLELLVGKRRYLQEKYGNDYLGPWGWAAPLFKGQKATFTALSELILPSFHVFYKMASVENHASSEGLEQAYVELDGESFALTGPIDEEIGVPAELTSGLLYAILGTVVPVVINRPGEEPDKSGEVFLGLLYRARKRITEKLPDQ